MRSLRSRFMSAKGQLRYGLHNQSMKDITISIKRGVDLNDLDNYDPKKNFVNNKQTIYRLEPRLCTPLIYAIKYANNPLQLIKLFIKHHADVNNKQSQYTEDYTALLATLNNKNLSTHIKVRILRQLLDAGVKIQSKAELEKVIDFLIRLIKSLNHHVFSLVDHFSCAN